MKFKDIRVGTIIEETNCNGKVVGLGMVAKKCKECFKSGSSECSCISNLDIMQDDSSSFIGGGCIDSNEKRMWIVYDDARYIRYRIAKNQNPYLGE